MSAHVHPLRTYLAVFAALLVGTALTTWVSTLDLGIFNDVVALAIAGTKAVLVILFFMHAKSASRLVWLFAGAGFFWLLILFVLIFADYGMRGPIEGWG
jgi:cytochrome c oxidase subunit IV